jgi:hypothetical protein
MAGVTLNDKRLAAEVRTLTLTQIKRVLNGDDEAFKKQLLLKLAPTVLPRIQEVTGEDGEPIKFNLVNYGQLGGSLPVSPQGVSDGGSEGSSKVQDSGDAQEGGQE